MYKSNENAKLDGLFKSGGECNHFLREAALPPESFKTVPCKINYFCTSFTF